MKPLGLSLHVTSPMLRVERPTRAEDKIWEAVEAARGGMSVREFIVEAREAWAYHARLEKEYDDTQFERALTEPAKGER